jgi:glycosyltransferase involved in cell wall biosynthesis
MKVAMIGSFNRERVALHVEALASRLVAQGVRVAIYADSSHRISAAGQVSVKNVALGGIPFLHGFLSVCAALLDGSRIIHFHGAQVAVWAMLARMCGARVVLTLHPSPEGCGTGKWHSATQLIEGVSVRCADHVVVLSLAQQQVLYRRYRCWAEVIPNGLNVAPLADITPSALTPFGLQPRRYVLHVGCFLPERRLHELIDAFLQADLPGWKLACVGDAEPDDDYACGLMRRASANVVFLSPQKTPELIQLYAQCGVFALPASHEGVPLALFEAMCLGPPVILSDISAHRALGLPAFVKDVEIILRFMLPVNSRFFPA